MLSGDNCSSVSELAEGYTYIRGRCKQLGNLYNPNRNDGRCGSSSEYEFIVCADEITSPVDGFEKQPEDICRRLSMSKLIECHYFSKSLHSFNEFTFIVESQVPVKQQYPMVNLQMIQLHRTMVVYRHQMMQLNVDCPETLASKRLALISNRKN